MRPDLTESFLTGLYEERTVALPQGDARLRESRFVTFDGAVSLTTRHQRPDHYRDLELDFGGEPRIARGGGYSYAAASFGEGVVVQDMSRFSRFVEFNEEESTIRVEAGASVHQLLSWAISNGLYFPVLPGYPAITVGGCIAADVHGKNPARDGTFSDWVAALTLFSPAFGFRTITKESEPLLFESTCGGFGLTGLIIDATLRLVRLPSSGVAVRRLPVSSFAETLEILRDLESSDFVYSWHDGTARGKALGRGILFRGEWAEAYRATEAPRWTPMSPEQRGRYPVSLWNRATARIGNAFFQRVLNRRERKVQGLFDASFPFAGQTAYHRFFGRPGLAESQLLVPHEAASAFLDALFQLVQRTNPPLLMISMKCFRGRQRTVSLTGDGVLIAIDLWRAPSVDTFLGELDHLALDVGAQPNVVKDSRLPRAVAARALPFYSSFKDRIRSLDPDRLYQSELSRRLGL